MMPFAFGAAAAAWGALLSRLYGNAWAGWSLVAASIIAGIAAQRRWRGPEKGGLGLWLIGGSLLSQVGLQATRFLGLTTASAGGIHGDYLGSVAGMLSAAQIFILLSATAGVWAVAVRAEVTRVRFWGLFAAGAAAGWGLIWEFDPAAGVAGAGIVAAAVGLAGEKPWSRGPLRARAAWAAGGLCIALSWGTPTFLRDVILTRLNLVYPGGRLLAVSDDGTHRWISYRFSTGATLLLRDGIALPAENPSASMTALRALAGARPGLRTILIVDPPGAEIIKAGRIAGLAVHCEYSSSARQRVIDAMLETPCPGDDGATPDAAILFVATSSSADDGKLAGIRLRSSTHLTAVLSPNDDPEGVERLAARTATIYGHAFMTNRGSQHVVIGGDPLDLSPVLTDGWHPVAPGK